VICENWRNHAFGVIPSGVIAGFHCTYLNSNQTNNKKKQLYLTGCLMEWTVNQL